MQAANGKKYGLNHIVTKFLPALENKLPDYKLRTLNAIENCRTQYMGGHIEACNSCGVIHEAYNSCRNRHCPQCGAIDKERWVMARENDLLPVKYFHVVFTVPDILNTLFFNNQKPMYNLLFTVVWDVIRDFGMTKKWIGGKIGATAILHTCGQNLHYHPHLHLIVPGGAIMPNGKFKLARNKGKFLFKVDQLSKVFQARFVEQVRILLKKKVITGELPKGLFKKNWVVFSKLAFGGPKQVVNYLARYTHRTAISNDRIINITNKEVTFIWKDYRCNYKKQTTTIQGDVFLKLFCMHILPAGFTRIRHYGFLSSASKTKSLKSIRKSLAVRLEEKEIMKPSILILLERMGINPGTCKNCGGKMVVMESIPNSFGNNQRGPPISNSNPKFEPCMSDF